MEKFFIESRKKMQMINITNNVREAVKKSGVRSGVCHLFTPHTTAGITINENADPDVQRDMMLGFEKMIPDEDYKHFEFNSPSHMLSTLTGVSETILIEDGDLVLGTWQGVYLCEFDGPRRRECFVKMQAD